MENNNLFDGAQEAIQAGKAWQSANASDGKGDALAIDAMVAAWSDFEGYYVVDDERHTFTLATFGNPLMRDGKRDNKATAARMAAIGSQLFGLPLEEDGRLLSRYQSRINRAYSIAGYIRGQFNGQCKLVKGHLSVPYVAVAPEPGEKAGAAEVAMYQTMKEQNVMVPLDGKKGFSLAELGKRADKWHAENGNAKAKRGTKAKDGSPLSLAKALEYIETILSECTRPDGEPTEALTHDMEARLFRIGQHIASYFAANPMDREERKSA